MSSSAAVSVSATANTTFVQADPSNFRDVVQKLTGAPVDPSTEKLPLTFPTRISGDKCPKRPAFRLHERRRSSKKLELDLIGNTSSGDTPSWWRGIGSPVSTLEFMARRSPKTPMSPCEEEDRAIAEKGFYLHPSPINTPRGSDPPELLTLFPLHSPRDYCISNDSSSS